jgi:hypothetical protein
VKRVVALACVALAACSAAPLSAPRQDIAAAESGPEARAAITAATLCVQSSVGSTSDGFAVLFDQATARRDPGDHARWIVAFPPGHYLGRLPPPGPGTTLTIAVEPGESGRCTGLPARVDPAR